MNQHGGSEKPRGRKNGIKMCEANQFAEGKLVTSAGRLKKMAES